MQWGLELENAILRDTQGNDSPHTISELKSMNPKKIALGKPNYWL